MKDKNNVAFTEEEALTDVLILQKNLIRLYATALTESANKGLRTILQTHYKDINTEQNQTFTNMQKMGYYELQKADKTMLDQKIETFTKMYNSL